MGVCIADPDKSTVKIAEILLLFYLQTLQRGFKVALSMSKHPLYCSSPHELGVIIVSSGCCVRESELM